MRALWGIRRVQKCFAPAFWEKIMATVDVPLTFSDASRRIETVPVSMTVRELKEKLDVRWCLPVKPAPLICKEFGRLVALIFADMKALSLRLDGSVMEDDETFEGLPIGSSTHPCAPPVAVQRLLLEVYAVPTCYLSCLHPVSLQVFV